MGDISVWGGTLKTTKTPAVGKIPVGDGSNFLLGNITSTGGTITVTTPSNGNINLEGASAIAGYGITISSGSPSVISAPVVTYSATVFSSSMTVVCATAVNVPVNVYEINGYSFASVLTLNAPSSPNGPGPSGVLVDGQKVVIRFSNTLSGGVTVSMGTGFSKTATLSLPSNLIPPGSYYYIGIVYNAAGASWNVVAVS